MKKQLQVRIFPDGHIEVLTSGIKGQKCTDYIKIIEKLLDAKTISSEFTQEYYLEEDNLVNENESIRRNEECQ